MANIWTARIECCHPECSFAFPSVEDLEWHLAEDHHKCYSYQCEQCYLHRRPSLFPTEAGVRKHLAQEHGLDDHYYRHLYSAEIDRKRERIQKDLEKCLKKENQQLPPMTTLKEVCDKELQTEQPQQDKEARAKKGAEKVPDLPPEIAVIKVELEEAEMDTIQESSKTSANLSSAMQQTFANRPAPTAPLHKRPKIVEVISACPSSADPRLRSHCYSSITAESLATSTAAETKPDCKGSVPFRPATITIQLSKESTASSEEDDNELEASWLNSSHSSKEVSHCSQEVEVPMVVCAICQEPVECKPVQMYLHINSCHLKYTLYTCRQCKCPFYGAWEKALEHLNQEHPTTLASLGSHHSVLLKDHSATYFPKIARTLKRYFPAQTVQPEDWKSLRGLYPARK